MNGLIYTSKPKFTNNAKFLKNCEQRSNISFNKTVRRNGCSNVNTFLPNVTPYFVSCS